MAQMNADSPQMSQMTQIKDGDVPYLWPSATSADYGRRRMSTRLWVRPSNRNRTNLVSTPSGTRASNWRAVSRFSRSKRSHYCATQAHPQRTEALGAGQAVVLPDCPPYGTV
jgi:hypothetical protein